MCIYDFSENSDSVNQGSNPCPPASQNLSSATDFAAITDTEAFAKRSPNRTNATSAPHKNGHNGFTVRSNG